MRRICDQFTNHSLNDTDISIQKSSHDSAGEGDPEVRRKPDNEERKHRAAATEEEDGFSTDSVRETTPEHACEAL